MPRRGPPDPAVDQGQDPGSFGRLDVLAQRLLERTVANSGDIAIMGLYGHLKPVTDELIDRFLGPLNLEDMVYKGGEKAAKQAAKGARKVRNQVRKKRNSRRSGRRGQ